MDAGRKRAEFPLAGDHEDGPAEARGRKGQNPQAPQMLAAFHQRGRWKQAPPHLLRHHGHHRVDGVEREAARNLQAQAAQMLVHHTAEAAVRRVADQRQRLRKRAQPGLVGDLRRVARHQQHEGLGDQPGAVHLIHVVEGLVCEDDIQAPGHELLPQLPAQTRCDAEGGHAVAQLLKQPRHERGGQRVDATEPQFRHERRILAADHRRQLAGIVQDALAPVPEPVTGGGQRHRADAPVEQLGGEGGFQLTHHVRHGRLGQAQLTGGSGHVAQLRHGHEHFEGVEVKVAMAHGAGGLRLLAVVGQVPMETRAVAHYERSSSPP
ncbi:protein of unknown function (plasmid) [Azospirillum baldaniorum]|uniref:Uncharacterized protein n=1 Tax=Azospirillum baldaniorum TaxID=1064539 RepID=A0A9P1NRM7_9PROT|nr:protein of unknown function [Azospirillum baldaniorum]